MEITIDCADEAGSLSPFWASTGFTPATLLLTRDMRQQIAYCGSIPRRGLRYARIHYLLDLVNARFLGSDAGQYDWSRLDQGLELLVQNGMAPIFELMGNPDGQFNDFNDDSQLRRWRTLVRDLALHLIERYGPAEVEGWLFESWNEPDIGYGWRHQWPEDIPSFCNYYDACTAGLADASPALKIGGPGTCVTLSPLFRGFLEHCDHGRHYFSGATGARLDFISVHEKAARAHKEDLDPRTRAMVEREAGIIDYIRASHPRLAQAPFMNNECDPQVGWKDHHTWHARPYYAAWACGSVGQHLARLVDDQGASYALLGNDHGFIGEWGNRTLLARFGPGDWIDDGQSGYAARAGWKVRQMETPPFALVKKPIFNAMALLSLLGDRRLGWRMAGAPARDDPRAALGVLPTLCETAGGATAVAVLVYYTSDRICSDGSQAVRLTLENLPFREAVLAHYRIDEAHGDPFRLWEEAGAPDRPDPDLLARMRAAQEPGLLEEPSEPDLRAGRLTLEFNLPLHSVSLLLLHPRPQSPPPPVSGLRCESYEGLDGQPEYLLRWDALPERSLRGYEVLRSDRPDGPFERVSPPDLLCSAYLDTQGGYYTVCARDFWNRAGSETGPVQGGS